ncbi:hypothetical protein PHLGIDRAFT_310669 [Phlebiopsis gigantea 11061_1 CR5-6]|uniref:Pentacotripeptide-repeat region of PRORP domain-containing protein n=1 Tax=Phlebiopsis gigantea (strain 11061_1 CR5-6) TaxID=745531 RepID=A0A0C3RQH7_PHLG1|nr:hypothetical protein PHLGIDRAFT_310669 [Phlebiopsis gigantea 11061_1 CR5-6]
MSYSGAVSKASRCLRASLPHSSSRLIRVHSPPCVSVLPSSPSTYTTRCISQYTRPPPRLPRVLTREELESFASLVCKDEPQDTLDTVNRLISNVQTLETLARVCITLMEVFASQGNINLADRILQVANKQFKFGAHKRVHAIVVQAFLASGHLEEAFLWLQNMRTRPGNGVADVRKWNNLLVECLSRKQDALFRKAVDYLRNEKVVEPDARMESLMKEYDKLNPSVPEHPRSAASTEPIHEQNVATMIAEQLAEQGEKSAKSLLHWAVRQGLQPTSATLEAVAAHISTAKSLHFWEKELSVVANHSVWATVLRNAAATQPPNVVVATYRVFLQRDLVPTPAIVHPIIRTICSVSLKLPTDDDIRLALDVYREYIILTKRHKSPPQDDLPIYNTLVRAIVSSKKSTLYPEAVSLLEELRARGIAPDAMTATSFITLLMQIAPDSGSALKVYQTLSKHPDGRYTLDGRGFQSILDTFARHCFHKPSDYTAYKRIVHDTHLAGHAVSLQNYTLLLRQLGALADRLRADDDDGDDDAAGGALGALGAVVRRVHNALTVEASVRPDTVFWNQLMDTYQRARCFRAAYAVWQALFVAGTFDNASVSIVADACAFAGAHALVAETFAKLHAMRFPLNQRNWANWVEGLARVGRIAEATKIVCLAMPREGVEPTPEMVRMLVAFAAQHRDKSTESEVRNRIRMYLPKLYSQTMGTRRSRTAPDEDVDS